MIYFILTFLKKLIHLLNQQILKIQISENYIFKGRFQEALVVFLKLPYCN